MQLALLSAGGMEHTDLVSAAVSPRRFKQKENYDTEKGERRSKAKSLQNGGIAVPEHGYEDEVKKWDNGENQESVDTVSHCYLDSTDLSFQSKCGNVHVHVTGHHSHTAKHLIISQREKGVREKGDGELYGQQC